LSDDWDKYLNRGEIKLQCLGKNHGVVPPKRFCGPTYSEEKAVLTMYWYADWKLGYDNLVVVD
jgi:hypothetical protein